MFLFIQDDESTGIVQYKDEAHHTLQRRHGNGFSGCEYISVYINTRHMHAVNLLTVTHVKKLVKFCGVTVKKCC
jgi:hypothetical protein